MSTSTVAGASGPTTRPDSCFRDRCGEAIAATLPEAFSKYLNTQCTCKVGLKIQCRWVSKVTADNERCFVVHRCDGYNRNWVRWSNNKVRCHVFKCEKSISMTWLQVIFHYLNSVCLTLSNDFYILNYGSNLSFP